MIVTWSIWYADEASAAAVLMLPIIVLDCPQPIVFVDLVRHHHKTSTNIITSQPPTHQAHQIQNPSTSRPQSLKTSQKQLVGQEEDGVG